jgi:hypothetical protein
MNPEVAVPVISNRSTLPQDNAHLLRQPGKFNKDPGIYDSYYEMANKVWPIMTICNISSMQQREETYACQLYAVESVNASVKSKTSKTEV